MPKNIETITEGGTQRQKYYYNSLNQLIREDNLDLNKTVTYTYDKGGNLQSSKEYAYQTGSTVTGTPTKTNTYSYTDSNWKDKLTAYNGNGVTSYYTLEGDRVQFERAGSTNIWYYYDVGGSPVAMRIGTSRYLYRKDLRGDVTGICSGATGALLVSYSYDAWGKPFITDVAGTNESARLISRNPYLYRGYRYDHETGLYYLNSRYYDPETGRFINADSRILTITNVNLYAYCNDNPINKADYWGHTPIWIEEINDSDYYSIEKAIFSPSQVAVLFKSSSHDVNRRPNKGEPGSIFVAPNGDWRK